MQDPKDLLGLTEEEVALSNTVEEVDLAEEDMYAEASPKGDFSKKAYRQLIKNLNTILPLFGLPAFEEITEPMPEWPADLTRVMMMIVKAIDDAIAAQEITPDNAIMLEEIVSDADMKAAAIRLRALSQNPAFKKFLTVAVKPETEEIPEETIQEDATPSDADMESLFTKRM